MVYGDEASKLIRECKRSHILIPYNTDVVRVVINEVAHINSELMTMQTQHPDIFERAEDPDYRGVVTAMMMMQRALRRNKQCLLAYHKFRLELVKQLAWEAQGLRALPADAKRNMSQQELEFYESYCDLLRDYSEASGGAQANLVSATLVPPRDLFIHVRALVDLGEIVTESGAVIELKKGQQDYVLRTDVEHLIAQGYLVHKGR
ncbi:GINS complex, Psf1 component [Gonapodya prolifera JEL478]|uniref:DNA replication complex GINS protein PSF1 n=1 Tax=Gonapodya prolifera (strain JEL478) TaxID=1344416 RepID=A0A139ANI3_GONPJ|nr:GINS complex, Psf1 component [Gonapodya prolifera JEL478]|eukprot:KXS18055.1 GINS complex, Psf1 component [Gonapodya prolifera JEL478]